MKNNGAIAVATIAAIVASLVAFSNIHPTTGPGSTPPPTGAAAPESCVQCAQLSRQVQDLQRALAAVEAKLATQQGPSTTPHGKLAGLPASPEPRDAAAAVADMQAARAADDERHHAYVNEVAQSFNNERVSAGWATQVASRINTTINSNEALKDIARNVECHEQTCRLQIEDDGSGKVNQNLPTIAMGLTDVLPEVSAERVDAGNGRSTMILYLSSERPQQAISK